MLKDHRDYYSDFSEWYRDERHAGYASVLDDLESDLVRRYAFDRDVLEVGCTNGLTLTRVAPLARRIVGVVLDDPPLERPELTHDFELVAGEPEDLPFDDESFDLVYSFKTLPHVAQVERAIREMTRVTKTGGHLLLEFYNPLSLRYLAERLAGDGEIARTFDRGQSYTRWDHPLEIERWCPEETVLERTEGLHVVTPAAFVHRLPYVRYFVRKLEFVARDLPGLKYFGGCLVAVLRKTGRL